MPSMKQQREINDLRDRVESLERVLGQIVGAKEAIKEPTKKRAKNGTV